VKTMKNHLLGRSGRHGFTLIELMVVIFIIGIMASFVGVNVMKHVAQARITSTRAQIKVFSSAAKDYKMDTGQYPDNAMGLQALVEPPPGAINWHPDGYLDEASEVPLDPWGNDYQYQFPGEYSTFDIFSYGPDGQEGGDDDIYNSDVNVRSRSEPVD